MHRARPLSLNLSLLSSSTAAMTESMQQIKPQIKPEIAEKKPYQYDAKREEFVEVSVASSERNQALVFFDPADVPKKGQHTDFYFLMQYLSRACFPGMEWQKGPQFFANKQLNFVLQNSGKNHQHVYDLMVLLFERSVKHKVLSAVTQRQESGSMESFKQMLARKSGSLVDDISSPRRVKQSQQSSESDLAQSSDSLLSISEVALQRPTSPTRAK